MKSFIKNEKKDIFSIFKRVINKDFKGNEGIAIKNSLFQFSKTFIGKVSGFIFTILLLRFLDPELFGLYSLSLSIVFIFVSFTDPGINEAIIKYSSKLIKNNKKAKARDYILYLSKLKVILTSVLFLILVFSAKFISNYYDKPMFLALLIGSIYLFSNSLITLLESIFYSIDDFKESFFKEMIFQLLRISLFLIVVFSIIQPSFNLNFNLFLVIACLSIPSFIALIFLFFRLTKKINFLKGRKHNLDKIEKKKIIKFILPLSAIVLSGVFFSYVDNLVLGKFVSSEFLGYYNAALKIIVSVVPLITFSIALYPIFSRLNGKKLENAFSKSVKFVFILSLGLFLFFVILAPFITILGEEYENSINVLRVLSLLLISLPLSQLYVSYFTSRGFTKILAKLLVLSTLLNLGLNYLFISVLVKQSESSAMMGAAIATLISNYLLLLCLYIVRRNLIKKESLA